MKVNRAMNWGGMPCALKLLETSAIATKWLELISEARVAVVKINWKTMSRLMRVMKPRDVVQTSRLLEKPTDAWSRPRV